MSPSSPLLPTFPSCPNSPLLTLWPLLPPSPLRSCHQSNYATLVNPCTLPTSPYSPPLPSSLLSPPWPPLPSLPTGFPGRRRSLFPTLGPGNEVVTCHPHCPCHPGLFACHLRYPCHFITLTTPENSCHLRHPSLPSHLANLHRPRHPGHNAPSPLFGPSRTRQAVF